MASPITRSVRSAPGSAGVALARGVEQTMLLSPRPVQNRIELEQLTVTLSRRLIGSGVAPMLPQVAFATLLDNALEHGSETIAPRAAVVLSRSFLTVRSHDAGEDVGHAADAKEELRRRIQLTAEDPDPSPRAPAGIPWLARLLGRRRPGSQLVFRVGDGQLAWRDGVWTCTQGTPVTGFLAVARIAL